MNLCDSRKRIWYLSGGMTRFGVNQFDESNNWRVEISRRIEDLSNGSVICFNPNLHWNLTTDPNEFTDREAMNLDIYKLRNSELVIYSNNDPLSRGSMIELGIAWERRIPIISFDEWENEIHPWLKSMSERIFNNRIQMLEYLNDHYIIIN